MTTTANPFTAAKAWKIRDRRPTRLSAQAQSTGVGWTMETLLADLQRRGFKVEKRGQRWWSQCPCPEHDDQQPSLSITPGQKGLLFKCWSGPSCTQAAVLKAIGPPPGWRTEPLALQLPNDPADCLCPWHWVCLNETLKQKEGRNANALTPAEESDLLGYCHDRQRQAITRVRIEPEPPRFKRDRPSLSRVLLEAVSPEDEALLVLPQRLGKNQRVVLNDLVSTVNGRLADGKATAAPYASPSVAKRVDLDARRVREALQGLDHHHRVAVKVGELPNYHNGDDGTPLYALAVRGPCPFCSRDRETAPGVSGLDAQDTATAGDRQGTVEPCGEQPQVTAVAIAEVEDLADAGLAASESRTCQQRAGSVVTFGHSSGSYAEPETETSQ